MSEKVEKRPSREWVKFGVLAVILLGVILVVSLTRPFIFDHVIPVVMGEGQPAAPLPGDAELPVPVEDEAPAEVEEDPIPVEEVEPTAEEVDVAEEEGEATATAIAAPPLTHTVQPGENIIQIAESYNITVDEIVAANNIDNPNHIEAGTTLVIPKQ